MFSNTQQKKNRTSVRAISPDWTNLSFRVLSLDESNSLPISHRRGVSGSREFKHGWVAARAPCMITLTPPSPHLDYISHCLFQNFKHRKSTRLDFANINTAYQIKAPKLKKRRNVLFIQEKLKLARVVFLLNITKKNNLKKNKENEEQRALSNMRVYSKSGK